MRAFDLSPLLRSGVGFDRFDRLFDLASRVDDGASHYPPYDIEKSGDGAYRVTMAVAGFKPEDLDVTVQENTLIVSGRVKDADKAAEAKARFLHRGIARRAFERRFELADTIKVTGARFENGLLHVDLARETPEALKPRKVAIQAEAPTAQAA